MTTNPASSARAAADDEQPDDATLPASVTARRCAALLARATGVAAMPSLPAVAASRRVIEEVAHRVPCWLPGLDVLCDPVVLEAVLLRELVVDGDKLRL